MGRRRKQPGPSIKIELSVLLDPRRISTIRRRLLKWYDSAGRSFPWRETKDAYRLWIAEVMLQQTQASRVTTYYERFIKRFPSARSLAHARWTSVLSVWRGLGYYVRARNLHAAAKMLAASGGRMPDTLEGFLALPGIGKNSAHSILSAAFHRPYVVLDTNVRRVLERLFRNNLRATLHERLKASKPEKVLWEIATCLISPKHPFEFNQAMMDLGATVCLPNNPKCAECPLSTLCDAAFVLERQKTRTTGPRRTQEPVCRIRLRIVSVSGGLYLRDSRNRIRLPSLAVRSDDNFREKIKTWAAENLGVEVSVRPPTPIPSQQSGIAMCRCQVLRRCGPARLKFVWKAPAEH